MSKTLKTRLALALLAVASIMSNVAASPLDFAEFDQRAQDGKRLTVAFLGGSLTWGAQATDPLQTSYRALIQKRLQSKYPEAHFTFVDAAIGGTGSQLASYRLERDVLAYEPDLVFLDFTVNDNPYQEPPADRLASYEGLVRRMVQADIPVVQVILTVKKDLTSEDVRPLDPYHKAIGEAYNLPIADIVALGRERVANGIATPDEMWDLDYDNTHPGDKGYAMYADGVWQTYLDAVKNEESCVLPDEMINADTYMHVNRVPVSSLDTLPVGWAVGKPHRNAVAFDFVCSRWMDDVTVATATEDVTPEPLTIKVKATNVLLFGEGTQKAGAYEVVVDGGEPKTYKCNVSSGNMRTVHMVANGMDPDKEHTITVTPKLEPGEELRIESICLSGGDAAIVD